MPAYARWRVHRVQVHLLAGVLPSLPRMLTHRGCILHSVCAASTTAAGDVEVVESNLPRSLSTMSSSATNRGRFVRHSTVQKAMPRVPEHLRQQRSPSSSPVSPRNSATTTITAASSSPRGRAAPSRPTYSSSWAGSPTRFVSSPGERESQLRGRRGGNSPHGVVHGRGARASVSKPLPAAPSRGRGRGRARSPSLGGSPAKPLPTPPCK
jgi:hypothetical protein